MGCHDFFLCPMLVTRQKTSFSISLLCSHYHTHYSGEVVSQLIMSGSVAMKFKTNFNRFT